MSLSSYAKDENSRVMARNFPFYSDHLIVDVCHRFIKDTLGLTPVIYRLVLDVWVTNLHVPKPIPLAFP